MLLPFYPGSHEDAWTRSKLIITQGPRHVCAAISIIIYYYSGSGYISIVYKLLPPVERLGPTTTPHAVSNPEQRPPVSKPDWRLRPLSFLSVLFDSLIDLTQFPESQTQCPYPLHVLLYGTDFRSSPLHHPFWWSLLIFLSTQICCLFSLDINSNESAS